MLQEAVQATMQVAKPVGEVTAVGTTIGAIMGWMPNVAALFAAIWYLGKFYVAIRSWYLRRKEEKANAVQPD